MDHSPLGWAWKWDVRRSTALHKCIWPTYYLCYCSQSFLIIHDIITTLFCMWLWLCSFRAPFVKSVSLELPLNTVHREIRSINNNYWCPLVPTGISSVGYWLLPIDFAACHFGFNCHWLRTLQTSPLIHWHEYQYNWYKQKILF